MTFSIVIICIKKKNKVQLYKKISYEDVAEILNIIFYLILTISTRMIRGAGGHIPVNFIVYCPEHNISITNIFKKNILNTKEKTNEYSKIYNQIFLRALLSNPPPTPTPTNNRIIIRSKITTF